MPSAVNQELLSELSSAYIYFKEKENVYNSLPMYEAQMQTTLEKCNKTFLQKKWITFVCLVLYCWACYKPYDALLTMVGENSISKKMTQVIIYYFEKFAKVQPAITSICAILFCIILLLVVFGVFIGFFFVVRHYLIKMVLWEKRKKYGLVLAQMVKNTEDSITALLSNYQVFSKKLGFECPIPFNYTHPEIVRQIAEYVMNGRADSVKEALNLMHMDEHHRQMLDVQSQILISAQNTERYAYSAAVSARWAAWNTFFR